MTDTPITVIGSALTPVPRSSHGLLSEDQVNAAVASVAQETVGARSAACAAWAAKCANDKLVTTASAAPDGVAIVKGN